MRNVLTLALLLLAVPVFAQDAPQVPRMFKGMEKGQWKTDILENSTSAGKKGRALPSMVLCTDNLMSHSTSPAPGQNAQMSCKRRVLKDTADEAVMENVCPDRTTTVTMKRENAKSVLMEMKSSSARGPQEMKIRYTSLGACRPGQGSVSYDKDSEQCVKIRRATAKMDPAKSCARSAAGAERDKCENMMRDNIAKMSAMCG